MGALLVDTELIEQAEEGSREFMALMAVDRHPNVSMLIRYFAWSHLPEDLRPVSRVMAETALRMIATMPDSPEMTMGLRKLLESKDCFVRAALDR